MKDGHPYQPSAVSRIARSSCVVVVGLGFASGLVLNLPILPPEPKNFGFPEAVRKVEQYFRLYMTVQFFPWT